MSYTGCVIPSRLKLHQRGGMVPQRVLYADVVRLLGDPSQAFALVRLDSKRRRSVSLAMQFHCYEITSLWRIHPMALACFPQLKDARP